MSHTWGVVSPGSRATVSLGTYLLSFPGPLARPVCTSQAGRAQYPARAASPSQGIGGRQVGMGGSAVSKVAVKVMSLKDKETLVLLGNSQEGPDPGPKLSGGPLLS